MRSKKPYVSTICKVFSFLGDVFENIKKQLVRTEIVTCFARTENRSRFTINALNYIISRSIIPMLHTFNRSQSERHYETNDLPSGLRPEFSASTCLTYRCEPSRPEGAARSARAAGNRRDSARNRIATQKRITPKNATELPAQHARDNPVYGQETAGISRPDRGRCGRRGCAAIPCVVRSRLCRVRICICSHRRRRRRCRHSFRPAVPS